MLKVKKLNEKLLEDVTGGVTACGVAKGIGAVAGGAAIASQLVGVGLMFTCAVYSAKAEKALKHDDDDSADYYYDKVSRYGRKAADFFTLGISWVIGRHYGINDEDKDY